MNAHSDSISSPAFLCSSRLQWLRGWSFLHVFDKDFLQDQGDARTIRMERINAHRGMILDQQGKPMAVSSPVVSLWANPSELIGVG